MSVQKIERTQNKDAAEELAEGTGANKAQLERLANGFHHHLNQFFMLETFKLAAREIVKDRACVKTSR